MSLEIKAYVPPKRPPYQGPLLPPPTSDWANFTYTYHNDSNAQIIVMFADFWNNHKLVLSDAKGVELPLTDKGRALRRALTDEWGNRDHNLRLDVLPGGAYTVKARWNLSELYDLAPGRYFLTLTYYERESYPLIIESNTIPVVIESPKKPAPFAKLRKPYAPSPTRGAHTRSKEPSREASRACARPRGARGGVAPTAPRPRLG